MWYVRKQYSDAVSNWNEGAEGCEELGERMSFSCVCLTIAGCIQIPVV
jgi:hypothetical protein